MDKKKWELLRDTLLQLYQEAVNARRREAELQGQLGVLQERIESLEREKDQQCSDLTERDKQIKKMRERIEKMENLAEFRQKMIDNTLPQIETERKKIRQTLDELLKRGSAEENLPASQETSEEESPQAKHESAVNPSAGDSF